MKRLLISASLLGLTFLSSCLEEFDCEKGTGPMITRTLNMGNFDQIDLRIAGTVYISQGPVQSVEVEGQENVLNLLKTTVYNKEWEIDSDRCISRMEDLEIHITVPNLERVKLSSSGRIIMEDVFDVNDFEAIISGSGEIEGLLNAEEVRAEITGSGTIKLYGVTDELDARIGGSGNIEAFQLESFQTDARITDSGNIRTKVNGRLNARISGSGNIIYRGFPNSVNKEITGSGNVYKD